MDPLVVQMAAAAPDQAIHVLHDYVVGKAGDYVGNVIMRGAIRLFNPAYRTREEIMRDEFDALKRAVDALIITVQSDEVLRDRKGNPDRATEAFAAEAFESVLETPFAAKHTILGRLVGERLQNVTESREDLFLREALQIVKRSNQQQLFAVASLYLVHHPPESLMPIEALVSWWDTEYLPLLQKLAVGWNVDDLSYLERLGAVSIDDVAQSDVLRVGSRPGAAIDNVLFRRNFGPADGPQSDPKFRSEFAIYASRLHSGNAGTTVWPDPGFPLFPYHLTLPGLHVGLTIINALSKRTIEESQNATRYPF